MKKPIPLLLLALLTLATPVLALDFDFSGTFDYDNDVGLAGFTVGSTSTVTIFTSSWQSGGFDPMLTLWLWNGSDDFLYVHEQDDEQDGNNIAGGSAVSNAVSYNYGSWDSYFSYTLAPGSYTVSITQYYNPSAGTNLSSGFQEDGNPNFTYDNLYGTEDFFNGILNNNDARTGDWALHITHVNPENHQSVPDASSTVALLGLAMLALVGLKRRFS